MQLNIFETRFLDDLVSLYLLEIEIVIDKSSYD